MAWCRLGDKQLAEPMMAYITDAHISLNVLALLAYWYDIDRDIA